MPTEPAVRFTVRGSKVNLERPSPRQAAIAHGTGPAVRVLAALAMLWPAVAAAPGSEVDGCVDMVCFGNESLDAVLKADEFQDLLALPLLARAYHVSWTIAYHSDAAVRMVVAALDDLAQRHHQDKELVAKIPKWRSFGPAGHAISLLAAQLALLLDQPIDDDGDPATPPVPRRAAWSRMLQASRDFRRTHRRMYANQAMISDLNLYLSNRGLAAIDPKNAMPEDQARRYLYEAVGIQPWLGDDTPAGPRADLRQNHPSVEAGHGAAPGSRGPVPEEVMGSGVRPKQPMRRCPWNKRSPSP
jgi:hypothetical protein